MDRCFSLHNPPPLSSFLPSPVKTSRGTQGFTPLNSPSNRRSLRTALPFTSTDFNDRKVPSFRASAGASHCDFSSLNAPLEPRSAPGKFLSGVLQNQRQVFHIAAADELKRLGDDRDLAVARMFVNSDSDEACLHRRIAQLKERECQAAVEDVMYMFIFYKFSEYRVPLVPKLSRCILQLQTRDISFERLGAGIHP